MAKAARQTFTVHSEAEPASLVRVMTEDRRLRVLQWLFKSPGYTANQAVLATLLAQVGHVSSADKVRVDLAWLADLGLVNIIGAESLYVARLTESGADVVTGKIALPGIARAAPDDF